MKITTIVITLNEEGNIADCLKSISWVDEIVIVDAGSDDRTVEIAEGFTPLVFEPGWLGYVKAKEFAIEKSSNEWILWLDADERITEQLREEIQRRLADNDRYSAYKIPRKSYFLGRWIKHCGWYPDYVIRLFKKDRGKFSTDSLVHESLQIDGKIGKLINSIEHFTFPTVKSYFAKFNNYTSLSAKEMRDRGKRFSILETFCHSFATFFKMYIQKRGFMDGFEGFILCTFSTYYTFVKFLKVKYE